jgi:hypothetical protein
MTAPDKLVIIRDSEPAGRPKLFPLGAIGPKLGFRNNGPQSKFSAVRTGCVPEWTDLRQLFTSSMTMHPFDPQWANC